jgi:antitoxin (DNA-binding transcriptional repressor) of toxin-antitoxin stability system
MGIEVNVAKAKVKLPEFIAAFERGEEVVIARASQPAVLAARLEAEDGRYAGRIDRRLGCRCIAVSRSCPLQSKRTSTACHP